MVVLRRTEENIMKVVQSIQSVFYVPFVVSNSAKELLHRVHAHHVYSLFFFSLQVTRLCDLSGDGDTVTSVSWSERVSCQEAIKNKSTS